MLLYNKISMRVFAFLQKPTRAFQRGGGFMPTAYYKNWNPQLIEAADFFSPRYIERIKVFALGIVRIQ